MAEVNAKWKTRKQDDGELLTRSNAVNIDPSSIRGVAMVIHGLNLRPSAMDPLIDQLLSMQIEVLQVTLSGHDMSGMGDASRADAFRQVSAKGWRHEVRQAYDMLSARAEMLGVEKYLLAYSIGALVGLDILLPDENTQLSRPQLKGYDKVVLLAPALSVRATSQFLRPLFWWPDLMMPSFSPRDYHANWGTPMAAYNALYDLLDHFDKYASNQLNMPSLIMVDTSDELVSPSGLKSLASDMALSEWRFVEVAKSRDAATWYHHLILDEWSLGKDGWMSMTTQIKEFLR